MNWENIGSFKYRGDLNAIYDIGTPALGFIAKRGDAAIRKGMEVIINKIIPKSDGDVHLEAFLSTYNEVEMFVENPSGQFTMIVYPSKGEVSQYKLIQEEFFTNIHQDPDPLIVKEIRQGIHLHDKITDNLIYFTGRVWIPNRIRGAVFYKKNPFLNLKNYSGFKEFFEECINKKRDIK